MTREAGLDRVLLVMGSNFGDIDNDGFLDMYLGTGEPAYFYVVPNVMLKNVEGKRFEDVTTSTGTGHLQKGHGISFADYDRDGDVDVFSRPAVQPRGTRRTTSFFRTRDMATTGSTSSSLAPDPTAPRSAPRSGLICHPRPAVSARAIV